MARTSKHKDPSTSAMNQNKRVVKGVPRKRKAVSSSNMTDQRKYGGARNRASPARLFKLYKHLTKQWRNLICNVGFGGLLDIGSDTLLSELSTWLIRTCVDAESCEIIVPCKGRIKVNAKSVHNILGLPLPSEDPQQVPYDLDVDAINFVHENFGIEDGMAPRISTIIKRIEANKEGNEDFLRSWLMVAISTFLCPSTCLYISPRCYPAIMDLTDIEKMNWCQFVVDQLKSSISRTNRNFVKGSLFFVVVLYLDSLTGHNIEISDCIPRIGAWNKKVMETVVELDINSDESFGKLDMKESELTVVQKLVFGGLEGVHSFVSSKMSASIPAWKKRKLSEAFNEVFTAMGSLLEVISDITVSSGGNGETGQSSKANHEAPK